MSFAQEFTAVVRGRPPTFGEYFLCVWLTKLNRDLIAHPSDRWN
jgi:hypothetical protein